MANLVKTFNEQDDFAAMRAAEHFLQLAGFSVGSNQRGDPRGVMFGDYDIAKWRNLNTAERKALHGQMTSDHGTMRIGPIVVTIFESAPHEAKQEFIKTARALR
jgi:hypothetical protein